MRELVRGEHHRYHGFHVFEATRVELSSHLRCSFEQCIEICFYA